MSKMSNLIGSDPVLTGAVRGNKFPELSWSVFAPVVNVTKESGKLPAWSNNELKSWNTRRAVGGSVNIGEDGALSYVDFDCNEEEFNVPIDYREVIAGNELNLEIRRAYVAQKVVELKKEREVAALLTNTANYATSGNTVTLSGTNKFSHASSTPIVTIDTAKEAIRSKVGFLPNVAGITVDAFNDLKNHSTILERVKYSQKGVITLEILQEVLGIPKIVLLNAQSASDDGATLTSIWGDCMLLAYVDPNVTPEDPYQPCFANVPQLAGHPFASKWNDPSGKISYAGYTDNFDAVIRMEAAGYLIDDCH